MLNIQCSIFNLKASILWKTLKKRSTAPDSYRDPLPTANCLLLIAYCLFASCNSTYTSRKKGYYKIDYPERKYIAFQQEGFPYTFEYPVYAKIVKDSTYFDSNPENPYWINVDFPQFGGRIFLSYKIIGGKAMYKLKQANGAYRDSAGINKFDNMVNDAFNLTNKNQAITSSIKDSIMHTPNGVTGVFFKVGGNAATSKQFFLSDTTKNFIRGALYFDVTPNADSLRPVQDFLQADIEHMINTFKWTNKGM
jgi:gliding motility-associated lipoprotein GldD